MVDMLPRWSWSNERHGPQPQTYSPPWQAKSDSHSPPSSAPYDDQVVPPAQPPVPTTPSSDSPNSDRLFNFPRPNPSRHPMTNPAPPPDHDQQLHRMAEPMLLAPSSLYPPRYHPPSFRDDIPSPNSSKEHDPYSASPPGTIASTSSNPTAISPEPIRSPENPDPTKTYSFVSLPGASVRKRPRRRYDEIERLYQCNWPDCAKAYGTLNHLNAHVTMQKHGPKRNPAEFKELRKIWRKQKKDTESTRMVKVNESPSLESDQRSSSSAQYLSPPPSAPEFQSQHHLRQTSHPAPIMDRRPLPSIRYSTSAESLHLPYQSRTTERWPTHSPVEPSPPMSPAVPFNPNMASSRTGPQTYIPPSYHQPHQHPYQHPDVMCRYSESRFTEPSTSPEMVPLSSHYQHPQAQQQQQNIHAPNLLTSLPYGHTHYNYEDNPRSDGYSNYPPHDYRPE